MILIQDLFPRKVVNPLLNLSVQTIVKKFYQCFNHVVNELAQNAHFVFLGRDVEVPQRRQAVVHPHARISSTFRSARVSKTGKA